MAIRERIEVGIFGAVLIVGLPAIMFAVQRIAG
jgi:hypothetical protein